MRLNKTLFTYLVLFVAVFLASCSQTQVFEQKDVGNLTTNLSITQDTEVVIPIGEESQDIIQNFSVIGEKKDPDIIEVKTEEYDTVNAITTKDNCYDSDGGFIFDKKGYIKDTNDVVFKDYCKDSTILVEYKCGLIGYLEEREEACEYGCDDGVCKKPSDEQICKDSDNGKVYSMRGTVFLYGESYTDTCLLNDKLKEYFCTPIGLVGEEEKLCDDTCVDGECVAKEVNNQDSCFDSDFGNDERYVKGFVKDVKGVVEDSCMNTNTVEEYKCNVIGFRMKENIFCPYTHKCVDGACVDK